MSSPILQLKNIQKKFDDRPVIYGLNLSVSAGELVSILGINGAGKTTIINLMLGLEKPNAGEIVFFGKKPGDMHVRHLIGVTPQETEFPEYLKCEEIIQLVRAHYKNPLSVAVVAEAFGLNDVLHRVACLLSGGQKRRLAIALAFIGNPQFVFLDEPTTGLDPESRQKIWAYIEKFVAQGGTVLLTTHYLEEAERLSTRVVVLEKGKITSDGTVADIKAHSSVVTVLFDCDIPLAPFSDMTDMCCDDNHYIVRTKNSDGFIRDLVNQNIAFRNLRIIEDSLENVFIKMVQESEK